MAEGDAAAAASLARSGSDETRQQLAAAKAELERLKAMKAEVSYDTSSPAAGGTPCESSSWLTLVVVFDSGKTWHGPRVRLYQRVRTLVEQCREHMSYPPSLRLRLYTGRTKMAPNMLLHDYHSLHNGSTVRVISGDAAGSITAVVRAPDTRMDDILAAVSRGIAKGCVPRLTMDGCGGTYLLSSGQGGGPVAVFKPEEEEAGAPLNPRGYVGKMGTKGMKLGVRSGEGAVREVAASLLDPWAGGDLGKGGCVPPTALVELEHRAMHGGEGAGGLSRSTSVDNIAASLAPALNMAPSRRARASKQSQPQGQLGSLQAFVRSEGVAGDYGPSIFPVQEVQKIALLDIRFLNLDRHDANILISQGHSEGSPAYTLTPIDHGNILPDTLQVMDYEWVWMEWPQVRQPLTEDCRRAVACIDPANDAAFLDTSLGIRVACLTAARLSTVLLKQGVGAGLTLHEVATMIVREVDDEPSELERLYVGAHRLARVRRRVVIAADPARSTEGDVELCPAQGTGAPAPTTTRGAPQLASQSSEGGSSSGASTGRSTVTSRGGSAVESSWAESFQSGSSSLSRAMSTPNLKVGAEFDDEDDISPSSKDDHGDVQIARALAFDDDGLPDDDDTSVSSIDSSSDDDDLNSDMTEGLAVDPFDVNKQNSRLGRSRSVHFNLAVEAGSSMRKSADGAASAAGLGAGSGYQTSWIRHRRSPMSKFIEGEQWLASATKLSAVGLRQRDVIHDDLFFVCFGEVCQTAIHSQLQQQKRRRATSDATHESGVCGDRVSNAPQQTRSCSTPQVLELVPLQATTVTENTAGGAKECPAPTATAWVPPHRRVRKVSFIDGTSPGAP